MVCHLLPFAKVGHNSVYHQFINSMVRFFFYILLEQVIAGGGGGGGGILTNPEDRLCSSKR